MSNFTYLEKEGYHESEEDSEDLGTDESSECDSTDVEEVDIQRSSNKQSTSAKVSYCAHFPYMYVFHIACATFAVTLSWTDCKCF